MHHSTRLLAAVFVILVALAPRSGARPAHAQAGRLCFPNVPGITSCIDGRFREYWEQNGGLAVFGYPVTAAGNEINRDTGESYLTQWFERNRFELHPENRPPYDVLLGRLGDDRLRQQGRGWQDFPKAAASAPHRFPETGHAITHEPFWSYWSTHGLEFDGQRGTSFVESLALFGYPISEAATETNANGDTVLTQWFERARFEWHPNNPAEFRVLLGLLGNEMRQGTPAQALKYFWPVNPPRGLVVQPDQSSAGESTFSLKLAQPGGQFDATITGGTAVQTPTRAGGQAVSVRGRPGTAFTTGAGFSVFWTEDGQRYAILGGLGLQDVLALAHSMEVLDLAGFQRRLRDVSAPQELKYLWPGPEVVELSVRPEPEGGSSADETSFTLHLYRPHSPRPDAIIFGGTAVTLPTRPGGVVTVRGQPGTSYASGADYSVMWMEGGHHYKVNSVGSLGPNDLLALAEDLEVIDLRTFRQRLRPE